MEPRTDLTFHLRAIQPSSYPGQKELIQRKYSTDCITNSSEKEDSGGPCEMAMHDAIAQEGTCNDTRDCQCVGNGIWGLMELAVVRQRILRGTVLVNQRVRVTSAELTLTCEGLGSFVEGPEV